MNKRKEVRGFWAKGTTCSREEIRNRCLDGRDAEENAEHTGSGRPNLKSLHCRLRAVGNLRMIPGRGMGCSLQKEKGKQIR